MPVGADNSKDTAHANVRGAMLRLQQIQTTAHHIDALLLNVLPPPAATHTAPYVGKGGYQLRRPSSGRQGRLALKTWLNSAVHF